MKANATAGLCGRRGGFSIVEVVVTMTLVAMFMAGAYVLIVQTSKLSRAARDKYIAATLCKNRLERARNFDYADLHLLIENNLVVNDNGTPTAQGKFRRTTTVNTNYVPPVANPGYTGGVTQISVTVAVKDLQSGSFGPMEETLSTLYTEYLE